MKTKIRRVFGLFGFIFVVWGCYRLVFRFPEEFEEVVLKPIIWLGPTFWVVSRKEKKRLSSLGLTTKNFFKSLYLGIGLGMIFALVGIFANFIKYGGLKFSGYQKDWLIFLGSFGVSFATAFCEETVFRGYIFSRLKEILKEENQANILTGVMFVFVHLPISIFVFHYSFFQLLIYCCLVFLFSFGSAIVFGHTENIFSSILAHLFWSWPIILFK